MRHILTGLSVMVLMASCSTASKFFASSNKKDTNTELQPTQKPSPASNVYMEQVTISSGNSKSDTRMQRIEKNIASSEVRDVKAVQAAAILVPRTAPATELQKKYAAILNVLPNSIRNNDLLETMDDWYGTRYQYGGTTKYGIDCSAFTREMYRGAYGIELPRTAREQYGRVRKISSTELKEGDLVFFNTTGGVSHVGMYLGNNKFVHASTSKGVTISDLYEAYYISRFIGAGRVEASSEEYLAHNNNDGASGVSN
ncbi:C40 family peptidase [Niabella drilacis]|uniref:Lipoprotein Spr n=1 Tax=Niabella drilacis (strain DSM 25811 / CCM 8410 / CCUG 62505 / LMG 26954 / E90) TaxID=1285928 RepID=A0A1G6IUR7_NIADE|nr:C40 family peptidase [Niabella drilacis]SDC10160.1 lipoprotein Spr [Niabella drilacis]